MKWIHRASGLLEPFTVPEITTENAITRQWHLREDGLLWVRDDPKFLPTWSSLPSDRPWGFTPCPIPWEPIDCGKLLAGLW